MKRTLFILTLLALLLVGCGRGTDAGGTLFLDLEDPSQASELLTTVMQDNYYEAENDNIENPPVWTVPAGEPIALTLENQGNARHNWVIIEQGAEITPEMDEDEKNARALYNSGKLRGGDRETVTFTAPEAGEYLVICSVAGHYPAMQGRLVAE